MDPEIESFYQGKPLSELGLILADYSLRFCRAYDLMKGDLGLAARGILKDSLEQVRQVSEVIGKRLDIQL